MISKFSFIMTQDAILTLKSVGETRAKFKANADRAMEKLVHRGVDRIKAMLEEQKFSPLAVTADWLARKRRRGWDLRTLIATRDYIDGIQAKRVSQGVHAIEADEMKAKLAEYGWKNVQGRPHWEPTFRELAREAGGIFEDEVLK